MSIQTVFWPTVGMYCILVFIYFYLFIYCFYYSAPSEQVQAYVLKQDKTLKQNNEMFNPLYAPKSFS